MAAWIDKEKWYQDRFVRVSRQLSVLQQPAEMSEKNQRQTELEEDEVVRVLGEQEGHFLVRKYDGTLGWIVNEGCQSVNPEDAVFRIFAPIAAQEFLEQWLGTPYLWGGVTRAGIDCSGFVQRYFLSVHGVVLPKHSQDQRRLGVSVTEPVTDDLVFVTTESGRNHVGVYWGEKVFHASDESGVCGVKADEFMSRYKLEAIQRLIFVKK